MSKQPDSHEPDQEQQAEGTHMSQLLEQRTRLMTAVLAVVGVFI
jgi:hypothetical protein